MFHKIVNLTCKNKVHPVLQIEFNSNEIYCARLQSLSKCVHTSDADQNGETRSIHKKFNKQFAGSIAEMAVEYFLNLIATEELKNENHLRVVRHDNIRIDGYQSFVDEYDIRMLLPHKGDKIDFGVRSSNNFKYDIEKGIEVLNLIGPYKNKIKPGENRVDFYIQVIFQLKIANNEKTSADNFHELFTDGVIDTYIVGGCSDGLIVNNGTIKRLGQNNTEYLAIELYKVNAYHDIYNEIKLFAKKKNAEKNQIKISGLGEITQKDLLKNEFEPASYYLKLPNTFPLIGGREIKSLNNDELINAHKTAIHRKWRDVLLNEILARNINYN